jgi:hypothetical protein
MEPLPVDRLEAALAPAALVPGAKRITRVSVRPAFRMPAWATPSSTPAMGASAAGSGATRFTGIELSVRKARLALR